MNSAWLCNLVLCCLCIMVISVQRQIEAKQRNVIWTMLGDAEKIPPESLLPHSRVKRIKRDAFDGTSKQGPEFTEARERVKEHLPVWNAAKGEPKINE